MDMFPIVLTTYEIVIRDRVHLARYDWRYIIVDEGTTSLQQESPLIFFHLLYT